MGDERKAGPKFEFDATADEPITGFWLRKSAPQGGPSPFNWIAVGEPYTPPDEPTAVIGGE
jgi:hypothetical protein